MSQTFLSFAYGSNMCTGKLRQVARSAVPEFIGKMENHQLVFNKLSIDGSGKGNVAFKKDSHVWGVVFRISDEDRAPLNTSESGYKSCESVEVVDSLGNKHRVQCYIAKEENIRPNLRPFDWYLTFVVRGAKQHDLPPQYIEYLDSFEFNIDTDTNRANLRNATAC